MLTNELNQATGLNYAQAQTYFEDDYDRLLGMTTSPDSSEPQLDAVTEINQLHADLDALSRTSLRKAFRIGKLLTIAKTKAGHDNWLPWIESNLTFSRITAAGYMRVYRNKDDPNVKSALHFTDAINRLADSSTTAHVANNSGEQEWYTPPQYIEMAREVMGGIDLDPASNETANALVGASRYFSELDDGLTQPWSGRVWMNPPYKNSAISEFCEKLSDSYDNNEITEAIALVNNATETKWFHRLAQSSSAVCFHLSRIRFWYPDRESFTPLQGQAFFYFGSGISKFQEVFSRVGKVYAKIG